MYAAVAARNRPHMAKFIRRVAKQAKTTEKEAKAVLEAVKKVLEEHIETGQNCRVTGLFTAVAVRKPGKDARTKKVFGKTVELPSKAPYTIVKLIPSRKLCVARTESD